MITDSRRKKLLYRAMHRGFKEADIVLGKFAEQKLPDMSDEELQEFEVLLEQNDRELYGWIIGSETPPAKFAGPVLQQLQAFPVAEALNQDRK